MEETEVKNGRIEQVNIDQQMRSAYIDYSMSVIVSRALPDVRDGFKPVHRRVLYGMDGLGRSLPVLSVRCLVNTIRMVTPAYMMQWREWLRTGASDIRLSLVRVTSDQWTVTL